MTENEPNIPSINEPNVSQIKTTTFDDDKNTKLHFAAAHGNLDVVGKEIENGHKTDSGNYLGWTPLMMAARNGHLDVVKTLIENRCDATRKNRFGASVFLMAVANGNIEIVHFLLQHLLCGGVSRQSMEMIFSPIAIAILFRHDHVVHYLMEKSFNINAANVTTNWTPLMFAAVKDNLNMYNLLVIKGADLHIRNLNNQTPQDILCARQRMIYSPHSPCLQMGAPNIIYMSPQPQYEIVTPNPEVVRKSSNLLSPSYYFAPNVSPVSPISFVPQMFFPPNFAPGQVTSPMQGYYYPNEMLNVRLNQSGFYSPVTQNMTNQLPCTNVHYQQWFDSGNKTPVL